MCNIRSSPGKEFTSITTKPFLAMFRDCACAHFMDKTTESLSSQAIDVEHCCCFTRSHDYARVGSRCYFPDKRCALRVTGRASGTKMRDSTSGTAVSICTVLYTFGERLLLSVIPCYFVRVWICALSPLLSNIVCASAVCNSQTILSCKLWTPIYCF